MYMYHAHNLVQIREPTGAQVTGTKNGRKGEKETTEEDKERKEEKEEGREGRRGRRGRKRKGEIEGGRKKLKRRVRKLLTSVERMWVGDSVGNNKHQQPGHFHKWRQWPSRRKNE